MSKFTQEETVQGYSKPSDKTEHATDKALESRPDKIKLTLTGCCCCCMINKAGNNVSSQIDNQSHCKQKHKIGFSLTVTWAHIKGQVLALTKHRTSTRRRWAAIGADGGKTTADC